MVKARDVWMCAFVFRNKLKVLKKKIEKWHRDIFHNIQLDGRETK